MWNSSDAERWRALQPILERLVALPADQMHAEILRGLRENPQLWTRVARVLREEAENPDFLAPPHESPREE